MRNTQETQVIEYESRDCDCCGGKELQVVWRYTHLARTLKSSYQWEVSNVVCRHCGFAFVSPVPSDKSLQSYYRDSISAFRGQKLDYSISNRVALIQSWIHQIEPGLFLEVGANDSPEFSQAIGRIFRKHATVELNDSCAATFRSLADAPNGSVDFLAGYFVLEHIPRPKDFLTECARVMKPRGLMIMEVPDRRLYPRDVSGLFLHEHTNHFSPRTLNALVRTVGLELMGVTHRECSRNFGFAAIFRQSARQEGGAEADSVEYVEYMDAIASIESGVHRIENFQASLGDIRRRIASNERPGPALIWAANEMCRQLLSNGFKLPSSAVIIDSDPRKRHILSPDYSVLTPEQAIDSILKSSLIVICTAHHAPAILQSIREKTGKTFQADEICVVDISTQ